MARFLFYISLCLIPLSLCAQTSGGGYAEPYLRRDVGSRAISMCGAYTAVANDPLAVFYNPAGLAMSLDKPQFVTMVSPMEYGRTQSILAYSQALSDDIGIGAGINNFMSGSFTGRDVMGNKLGDFSDWQMAATIASSVRVETASIGASLKYLTHNLRGSGLKADGYALDVGTKMNVMDIFSLGIAINNLSAMMFWNTKTNRRESIPYTIRVGGAMEFPINEGSLDIKQNENGDIDSVYSPPTRYLLLSLESDMTEYERSPNFVLGAECMVHEIIGFRAGLELYGAKDNTPQLFPMNRWGAGVTFRPKLNQIIENLPFQLTIDYSVAKDQISSVGLTHALSLQFQF